MPGLLVSQFAFYQISSIHHPSWFPLQDYPRPASFMVQKLWASEPHAWSGLTPALQPVKDDGAMWPQHWALWRYISAAVSCRSSPRNASFVQNCPMDGWMDGAWGLQKLQTTAAACKILSKHSQSVLLSTYLSAVVGLFSQGLLTPY